MSCENKSIYNGYSYSKTYIDQGVQLTKAGKPWVGDAY